MKIKHLPLFVCLLCMANFALGQGFTVQPTQHELDLEPGQSTVIEITVKNTTDVHQVYNLYVGDWTMSEEGAPQYFDKTGANTSCADWVTLEETLVELAPNESKRIPITFIVPAGESGSKWAAVLVEPAVEQLEPDLVDNAVVTGGRATIRIGVPIFLNPSSDNSEQAVIYGLKEAQDKVFTSTVHNKGGKVIRGNIYTTLSNVETGEEVQLKPFEVLVLPGLKRDIQFRLPETVAKGNYLLTCILDYSEEKDYEGTRMEITIN